jgi:hypothetical protein
MDKKKPRSSPEDHGPVFYNEGLTAILQDSGRRYDAEHKIKTHLVFHVCSMA